ncbi:response regulator [Methanoplanus endosymbiosus]|uniref:Response regulator n=1 Tax=Methanoplanus endosymbiosus TaxID=33865 RepID=A0A9E7PN23_9EURY|nr:response regulator [Methanoplanus endosymbiosus]UUX93290.1 response regulator [Methanoplanus endosymbiosus]
MTEHTEKLTDKKSGAVPVLIIDDLYENRYLLEVTLKSKGYQVITARNGQEAMEYLHNHPVRLIISDILMPKMDGFQLCREVKKDPDLKNIPFIFYTASYTSDKDRDFGLDLGADRYIIKPTESSEFLAEIDDVLAESNTTVNSEPLLGPENEGEYLKEYSERIFHKLEKKIRELEKKNQEYEKSQQNLQESEEKFRELFENISSGVAVLEMAGEGSDFIFVDINKASEQLDHVRREDVVGNSIFGIFPGIEEFDLISVLQRVNKTGTPEHIPLAAYKDEQTQVWRENYVYRLPSGELVVVYNDVTGKKRAEDALIESEFKYHEIFNNINEAVFLHEVMSDNSRGNFVEVNDVACHRLGYSREELLNRSVADINTATVRKDDPERVQALHNKKELSFDAEHVRKDGSVFPVHVNARMIELQGRHFILSIVRDMTEEYEARNREAIALRQIEQNLTQLAILNDEIRNPLAVIAGTVDLYDEKIATPVLEQVQIINDIIIRLDRGWLESEKIREYMRKYHDI